MSESITEDSGLRVLCSGERCGILQYAFCNSTECRNCAYSKFKQCLNFPGTPELAQTVEVEYSQIKGASIHNVTATVNMQVPCGSNASLQIVCNPSSETSETRDSPLLTTSTSASTSQAGTEVLPSDIPRANQGDSGLYFHRVDHMCSVQDKTFTLKDGGELLINLQRNAFQRSSPKVCSCEISFLPPLSPFSKRVMLTIGDQPALVRRYINIVFRSCDMTRRIPQANGRIANNYTYPLHQSTSFGIEVIQHLSSSSTVIIGQAKLSVPSNARQDMAVKCNSGPLEQRLNCPSKSVKNQSSDSNPGAIIAGIVVTAVVIATLIIVGILVFMKRRKNLLKNREQRPKSIEKQPDDSQEGDYVDIHTTNAETDDVTESRQGAEYVYSGEDLQPTITRDNPASVSLDGKTNRTWNKAVEQGVHSVIAKTNKYEESREYITSEDKTGVHYSKVHKSKLRIGGKNVENSIGDKNNPQRVSNDFENPEIDMQENEVYAGGDIDDNERNITGPKGANEGSGAGNNEQFDDMQNPQVKRESRSSDIEMEENDVYARNDI